MTLAFRLEAALARLLVSGLRALGPVRASNACGALVGWVGPKLPVSRVADTNLRIAFPGMPAAERRQVAKGAWQSLGRTVGELPHIARLNRTASGPGWDITGEDTVRSLVAQGGPVIFFSGHFGNWEVLPRVAAAFGLVLSGMYRAATNPLIDDVVVGLRREAVGADVPMFPKGAAGARGALAHLRAGRALGMLMDQKMNDGVKVNFFGQPAMTASACAALALRFRCPVVPAYAERTGPARFHLVCEAPLPLPDTGDRQTDILELTQAINDRLEAWIRARPTAWLWMHRRWTKSLYRKS